MLADERPHEFVTKVAVSDMMEIEAAKLALSEEPDGDTKPFAERMVKDHEHRMQVKAHEQAVELFDAYARKADNPDLKAWAVKILPHLKQHLVMAKKLTSKCEAKAFAYQIALTSS